MVCVPLDKVSSVLGLKLALHVLEGVQKRGTEEREREREREALNQVDSVP